MLLNLNHIGQIGMPVSNADRSEAFYSEKLGFRKLFRFGNMVYFDCAGVRLWLDQVPPGQGLQASVLYFRCADIRLATKELELVASCSRTSLTWSPSSTTMTCG